MKFLFEFKELKHIDFDLCILLTGAVTCILLIFLYCLFGKIATESFENMSNCLYESKWNELSPNLQKYFVLMIGNAQIPVYYHGFDLIILNLETFSIVCSIFRRFRFEFPKNNRFFFSHSEQFTPASWCSLPSQTIESDSDSSAIIGNCIL